MLKFVTTRSAQSATQTTPARVLARASGYALALIAASLGACTNPLGPLDTDYGSATPDERLRRIESLDRDRYFRPKAPGSESEASSPSARAETRRAATSPYAGLEKLALGLEEARAAALTNNLDLKVAMIDPTIASEQLRVEEGKFDAVFRPSIAYQDANNPALDTTAANAQRNTRFGSGVDVPLYSGGRASVDLFANRQQTDNPFFTFNSAYSTAATFSISQPLLRNAGRRASTFSIRIAEFDRRITESRTKLEIIRQLANVDRSYWRLYAASKVLEVRQKQFELAEAQLARAQRRVSAGDAPEVEIVRAEAGVASRVEGVLIAANDVDSQVRELKRIVNMPGLELETRTLITTATEPEAAALDLDQSALVALGLANRMEMLELELRIAQDFFSIEQAKNQTLPLVTFDYQYSIPGLGTNLGNSVQQLRGLGFHNWEFQLSGQVPLGNDQARARLQSAILQRLQRLSSKAAREQAITAEVLQASSSAKTAWQRILAARQNVIAAARTLEAEQRQFDAGSRTSTDVLDAASRVAEAQSGEIAALADYQIAQVDLAFATGTLLGAGKVDWSPSDPRENVPASYPGEQPGDPTPPVFPPYADPDRRAAPSAQPTFSEP
jgi:outer membrane protein